MLKITVVGEEFFDESTETFSTVGDAVLELEHSLLSLSKWESEFQKPFLVPGQKTTKEVFDYIKAMIITTDFPPDIIERFSKDNIVQINDYIDSKQSATTFGQMPKHTGRGEIITSELIYYWMVAFNIPFVCETWHLNRLFSLIRICNVKNSKPRKMSRNELNARNRELNAQRKAQLGTTG
jgi:hypothetical protein